MKNFRRNLKAISPIFATLILIAIAVIAGVVVYAFTSGMLSGMTATSSAAQEKISVQSSGFTNAGATNDVVKVYAQQTGGPAAVFKNLIIKDSSGNTVTVIDTLTMSPAATPTVQGTLYTISGTIALGLNTPGQYTATLVTAAGGNFVSPSFTVS